MALGLAGGFDLVLAVSSESMGGIIESKIRGSLILVHGVISVSLGNLGTLSFTDLAVQVFPLTTPPVSFDLRIGFLGASIALPAGAGVLALGSDFSSLTMTATLAVVPANPAGTLQNLILTFDPASVRFQADDEAAVTQANLTEAIIASAVGQNLSTALTAIGLSNPLVLTPTPIPVVGIRPPSAAGVAPGLAALAVAVLPLASPVTVGEGSIAFCLTLQSRPDSPVGRGLGNPALLTPMALAPGADALLIIDTAFFFELLASMSLEAPAPAGLGAPGGSFPTVNRTGIFLTTASPPVPITLGGTAGFLTALAITPPPAGSTTITMALTFTFMVGAITYVVTLIGATFTLALSGGTLVIAPFVPTPTVTSIVPWWVYVVEILGGAVLGALTGGILGAIVGAVAGGLTISLATSIVSAFTTVAAGGGFSSIGAPALPTALTTLLGPVGLTPPLVFDDLQFSGRTQKPEIISIYRSESALAMQASGASIDLDSGTVRTWAFGRFGRGTGGTKIGTFGDLDWTAAYGLTADSPARINRISGSFNSIAYDDAKTALLASSVTTISPMEIPVIPQGTTDPASLPAPLVIAVKTDQGYVGKVALWQDVSGDLVLRYRLWDPSGAACRILPVAAAWTQTGYMRDPDTAGTGGLLPVKHERFQHQALFTVQTVRMQSPLQVTWLLGGVTLSGTGRTTIAGSDVAWQASGSALTLTVELGSSLDLERLEVEVRDTNGVNTRDSQQLTVRGRYDAEYVPGLDTNFAAAVTAYDGAYQQYLAGKLREQVDLPQLQSQLQPLQLDVAVGNLMEAGGMPVMEPPLPIR